jgi:hypothetical protein
MGISLHALLNCVKQIRSHQGRMKVSVTPLTVTVYSPVASPLVSRVKRSVKGAQRECRRLRRVKRLKW